MNTQGGVLDERYLSLTRLAFAKQSQADFIETIKIPGMLTAIGYCSTSPNASVPVTFPTIAIPG